MNSKTLEALLRQASPIGSLPVESWKHRRHAERRAPSDALRSNPTTKQAMGG